MSHAQALSVRQFAALKVLQWAGLVKQTGQLQSVQSRGGWWPIALESYAGAFQQDIEVSIDSVLTYSTVYACLSLISSDIGKMRLMLVEEHPDGTYTEYESPSFSPFLEKPNHFQSRIKFYEYWVLSKLIFGNSYVLKARDGRGVVVASYVLDPQSVRPLVAANGDVYYELKRDYLSGQTLDSLIVPAADLMHDPHKTLYHPLVGVSPIHACGVTSTGALTIQNNSTRLFANGSRPGGVLTAPGHIDQTTAERIKTYWETEFTGENVGKVAVLGDGLKFEKMSITAEDAQLIEQLKWAAEQVCTCFQVPGHLVGVGPAPTYNNIQALNTQYYTQCLQTLIECIEITLDWGLGLAPDKIGGRKLRTKFDIDDLLRMDTATLVEAETKIVGAGIKAPNESRRRMNLPPVKGGDSPMMQNQNWSLHDLDERRLLGFKPPDMPDRVEVPTPNPQIETEDDEDKSFDWVSRFGATLQLKSDAAGIGATGW